MPSKPENIDWNDPNVRETANYIIDAGEDLLENASKYAPGHENEFLSAIADALECDHPGCDCGGAHPNHWPLTLAGTCPVSQECLCKGTYHKTKLLVLDYGS